MSEIASLIGNAKLQIEFKPQNATLVDSVMALNETPPEYRVKGHKKTKRVAKLTAT
jgi:hypothetical protein